MQFQNKTFIALLCILITLFFYAAAYSLLHCCAIFFAASTPHCCVYTCCCVAALHLHFFANSALLCILQRHNTLSFLEQLLCPTLQIYTVVKEKKKLSAAVQKLQAADFSYLHCCVKTHFCTLS